VSGWAQYFWLNKNIKIKTSTLGIQTNEKIIGFELSAKKNAA
jgi:hypothetical protein